MAEPASSSVPPTQPMAGANQRTVATGGSESDHGPSTARVDQAAPYMAMTSSRPAATAHCAAGCRRAHPSLPGANWHADSKETSVVGSRDFEKRLAACWRGLDDEAGGRRPRRCGLPVNDTWSSVTDAARATGAAGMAVMPMLKRTRSEGML